jgi:branched-chain amino acid transport system ATP-binding protein
VTGNVLLEVTGLRCSIGGVQALNGAEISVPEGALHGIVGPNGAGKTTLFNAITGFVRAQEGEVLWCGRSIRTTRSYKIANRGLVRTFQNAGGLAGMTVRENIVTAARKWSGPEIDEVVDRLGIGADQAKRLEDCSLATRKLVGIAMAVVRRPKLLLLDEPLSGLDVEERDSVVEMIQGVNQTGVAILLIEHDVDRTLAMVDHLSILDLGEVIAAGTPADLRGKSELNDVYLKA